MRPKMIFKIGVTVVIAVAVIIVYIRRNDPDKQLQGRTEGEGQGHVKNEEPVVNGQRKYEDEKILSNKIISDREEDTAPLKQQNIPAKQKTQQQRSDTEDGEQKASNGEDKTGHNGREEGLKSVYSSATVPRRDAIHLSVVACGDRKDESLVLLKSAILFTKKYLVFHIFAEEELQKSFHDKIEFWPQEFRSRLDYFIYNITFPTGENADQWKKLFKPCASQRLFLPVLLTQVDSLIYVDTDILFLRPLEDLWSFFQRFNATQLAALSPEHEDSAAGWYNRFARHPYYGKLGLNSGVMLMNLTRLRESVWLVSMLDYYKEYKLKIAWGDQDLINIYFHFYPEQVYVYGCDWNYRADHCMYMSVCKVAETEGASVLHGSRRVMHNDKQPAFRAVYETFKEHRLGDDIQYKLLINLERKLKDTDNTRCGKVGYIFTKQIQIYCKNMREAERKARHEKEESIEVQHPPS